MKQNRIMFAALVLTALLMTACDKEPQGFDSFILNTADFNDANGSKATWNASGYWWESGDNVYINGETHSISYDGSTWKTHLENDLNEDGVTAPESGKYNVVYVGGAQADYSDGVYGPVEFDGTFVPLAISGNTNRMTLYPCCAVIRSSSSGYVKLDIPAGGGTVLTKGYINSSSATLSATGESEDVTTEISASLSDEEGNNYFIIPMEGSVVRAQLTFDGREDPTNGPVEIRKGILYIID